jgi:hypothetical protein
VRTAGNATLTTTASSVMTKNPSTAAASVPRGCAGTAAPSTMELLAVTGLVMVSSLGRAGNPLVNTEETALRERVGGRVYGGSSSTSLTTAIDVG